MNGYGVVTRNDGSRWRITELTPTSDGFLLGTGVLIDDDGDEIHDEAGWLVCHSFFLGATR